MVNQNDVRFGNTLQDQHGNFHDRYVLLEKISQGDYRQVHLACKLEKKQKTNSWGSLVSELFDKRLSLANCAPNRSVKVVDLRLKTKNLLRLAQNEVEIWKNLGKHNHIVHLIDVRKELDMCFFIMEMCSTSLLNYLSSIPLVDERTLGESFAQMLLGVEFLHKAKVVHRDVKPDNFVVGGNTGRSIKLCDFSLAKVHDSRDKLTGECGTALFMAPEMVLGNGYDMKVDIWSFGVIVYALFFGRFPYDVDEKDSSEVKQAIASAKSAPCFRTMVPISPAALAFTMSLLCRDPRKRPIASTALKKQFMVDIIETRRDVHNCDLPNLKDHLRRVKQVRAFQNKELLDKSEIDDLLNQQQLRVHKLPLPKMKQQSIVVSQLSSSRILEDQQKSEKRNSLSNSLEGEKFGFALGEQVQCTEAANGITLGAVGKVVGFTDFLVNVEFPGFTRRKFTPSDLVSVIDKQGSMRSPNNWSPQPSMNWSPQESLLSSSPSGSTLMGSLFSVIGSSSSLEAWEFDTFCDV
jgi:calcium/calmodulin-dependent protein kinase (CaM kinase) II